MKIAVREKSTGNVVYTAEVIVGGMNYTPSEKEAFDEAWRTAVEDGEVDVNAREKYDLVRIG